MIFHLPDGLGYGSRHHEASSEHDEYRGLPGVGRGSSAAQGASQCRTPHPALPPPLTAAELLTSPPRGAQCSPVSGDRAPCLAHSSPFLGTIQILV